jgi:hypothetical protein
MARSRDQLGSLVKGDMRKVAGVVGLRELESLTFAVSRRRSNQLSYRPLLFGIAFNCVLIMCQAVQKPQYFPPRALPCQGRGVQYLTSAFVENIALIGFRVVPKLCHLALPAPILCQFCVTSSAVSTAEAACQTTI